ncbi:MAG TPA: preprotein translocase subunit SecE [Candidatus Hydrogenedentes bacterium]|nr:preprotein translocase subunit SecE [Candidatus Hydrogenedentota bacterium]
MLKQTTMAEGKPGVVQRVQEFFQEVRTELGKVTWPTVNDLKVSTKVTMLLLGIVAAIIFLFDQVFQRVILVLLNLAA